MFAFFLVPHIVELDFLSFAQKVFESEKLISLQIPIY